MRNLLSYLWLFAFFLTSYSVNSAVKNSDEVKKVIYIAVAGPMSGDKWLAKGAPMVNGAQMKIDEINASGSLPDYELKLLKFDDFDDERKTPSIARQIYESEALAILGHRGSNASVTASEIYKDLHIPAITGSALAEQITQNNPWYFSVIPNNASQGQTLAYYASHVLLEETVGIIVENNDFGESISQSFEEYADDAGLQITQRISIDPEEDDLVNFFSSNGNGQLKKPYPDILLFAVKDKAAVPLLKSYRKEGLEIPILGTGSMGKQSFPLRFKDLPEEKELPGFYSEGVFATSYVIFDIGSPALQGFRKRYIDKYHHDPDGSAASYYDAAGMAINAIKHIDLVDLSKMDQRSAIRNHLDSHKSIVSAYDGVMGKIFFNENGSSKKPILVAQFKQGKMLSANVQLNPISSFAKEHRLIREFRLGINHNDHENIIVTPDQYLEKTNIAYIGSRILSISEIDTLRNTSYIEFDLWVNSQEKLDLSQVTFSNSVEALTLGKPVIDEFLDGTHHLQYKISGIFNTHFTLVNEKYGDQVVGFNLVDRGSLASELVFVGDELNMPSTAGKALIDDANKRKVLGHNGEWKIDNFLTYTGQTIESALGAPLYSRDAEKNLIRPNFTNVLVLKSSTPTLRRSIPAQYSVLVILIALSILIVPLFGSLISMNCKNPILDLLFSSSENIKSHWMHVTRFMVSVVTILTLLVALEVSIIEFLSDVFTNYEMSQIILVVDMLWWIIPGYFVNKAIKVFVWMPIELKTARPVTNILRNFVRFLVYVGVIFGIVGYVFDQSLISLLTTFGMFGVVIGFAIKTNLSNIFSGIAINIERPIRVGDWIEVSPHPEGRVIDINWRATRLRLRDDSILCLPNTYAAEHAIRNISFADNLNQIINITIDPHHNPQEVETVLLAALKASSGVLNDPIPEVGLVDINKKVAEYKMSFYIADYVEKNDIMTKVWNSIWDALNDAGITRITPKEILKDSADEEEAILKG